MGKKDRNAVTYSGGTNTNKHLQELGTRDCNEGYIGLTSCGLGQQGFACTRRSCQDGTFWNLCSQVNILLWVLQEVDKLHYLYLGFLTACDISAKFEQPSWFSVYFDFLYPK